MQRETIIQLAAEMFVGQGIKAVRMDDIARHIGVSKRTIYEQFGDKEELLYQCLSYYVREQDRRHAELGAQAKNVLEAMLLVFGDVMDKAEISHRLQSNLRRFYPKVYERLVAERRSPGRVGAVQDRTVARCGGRLFPGNRQLRSGHYAAALFGRGVDRAQGRVAVAQHVDERGAGVSGREFPAGYFDRKGDAPDRRFPRKTERKEITYR